MYIFSVLKDRSLKKLWLALLAPACLLLSPFPAGAQANDGLLIIGFNDSSLKFIANRDQSLMKKALEPLIPSGRARTLASHSLGRLKRKVIGSIAKGSQRYLPLIDAKYVAPRAGSAPSSKNLSYAKQVGLIKYAERNIRIHAFQTPDDPQFKNMWGLKNGGTDLFAIPGVDISAPEAWKIRTGTGDAVVAVLDTGIDPSVKDLQGNIWVNSGEIPGNGIDDDKNGYIDDVNGCDLIAFDPKSGGSCGHKPFRNNIHGTHVAGTIGARGNNGTGISGVAWNTKLISLAFLDDDGSGSLIDMIEGLSYVVDMKKLHKSSKGRLGANIRVVNASFGHGEGFLQSEYDAIKKLRDQDVLLVAAAGNGGADGIGDNNDRTPGYPSGYDLDNIISVAAVGKSGRLTFFSNYGVSSVDIAAPGEGILSTVFNDRYQALSGTSMAAPHVAGAAALVMGHRPGLSAWVVKEILIASAKNATQVSALKSLGSKVAAGGMLDLKEALILAEDNIEKLTILKNPQSQSALTGGDVTFSVTALGGEPINYQWFKNGAAINGATRSSLTIKKVSAGDAGRYKCTVSNGPDSATSRPADLSIIDSLSGDVNSDGKVDVGDLVIVMLNLGKPGTAAQGDLNGDGRIDFTDLTMILKFLKQ